VVPAEGMISMRLEGKTAFITGADSGIGRATALTFAREGADVAIHAFGDHRGAVQAVEAIREHGRRVELFEADFADPSSAEGLVAQVVERMGKLDILVNNAGKGERKNSALDVDTQSFVEVLNVDLVAPFILAREAARHMAERGTGSIINITSVHEEIPNEGSPAYCAAKGGLRMVTRTMTLELAPKGVRINNIGPGMIKTPMTVSSLFDAETSDQAEAKIPMGRAGEQQEIANLALFLASDESSYVTGSSYFADGGLMLSIQGA
jgi:glucose 1-dehydrogenase